MAWICVHEKDFIRFKLSPDDLTTHVVQSIADCPLVSKRVHEHREKLTNEDLQDLPLEGHQMAHDENVLD